MPRHHPTYDNEKEYAKNMHKLHHDDYDDHYEDYDDTHNSAEKFHEDYVVVPPQYHRIIIGQKGDTINDLRRTYNVEVDVPEKAAKSDKIYITGAKADVEACKKRIQELVAQRQMSETRRETTGVLKATGKNEELFPSLDTQGTVALLVDFEKFAHGKFLGTKYCRYKDLEQQLLRHNRTGPKHAGNVNVGVSITVPDKEDVTEVITINVPKHMADDAEKIIRGFVDFYELNQHFRGISRVTSASAAMKGNASQGELKVHKQKGHQQPAAENKQPTAQPSTAPAVAGSRSQQTANVTDSASAELQVQQMPFPFPKRPFRDMVEAGYTHKSFPQRAAQ